VVIKAPPPVSPALAANACDPGVIVVDAFKVAGIIAEGVLAPV
jgi:hypothetical protein